MGVGMTVSWRCSAGALAGESRRALRGVTRGPRAVLALPAVRMAGGQGVVRAVVTGTLYGAGHALRLARSHGTVAHLCRRRWCRTTAAAPGAHHGNESRDEEDSSSAPHTPHTRAIGPLTEDEDARAKGMPGVIKGGGVLLRVVVFSLAVCCHAVNPAGIDRAAMHAHPGSGSVVAGAVHHLVGTPLLWFAGSFVAAAVASGALLTLLQRRGAFQPIRSDGPQSHTTGVKTATPTMGGVAFIPAGALTALVSTGFGQPVVLALVVATLAFMLIGAYDDLQKLRGKSNYAGLSPRAKLGLQCTVASALCVWLAHGPLTPPSTSVTLAGLFEVPTGNWFWALSAFAMVAESNAVNVTDGLDGLAASTSAVAFVSTGISLLLTGRAELGAFAICMGGAAAGFLVVNRHPASCFMGDTGSLALGGALGAVAAAAGGSATFPLVLTSGVFIAEVVSVMLQVGYFKYTKKRSAVGEGKRLFRMAPLHHHLELSGWSEVRVVAALTAAAAMCALLGVLARV